MHAIQGTVAAAQTGIKRIMASNAHTFTAGAFTAGADGGPDPSIAVCGLGSAMYMVTLIISRMLAFSNRQAAN